MDQSKATTSFDFRFGVEQNWKGTQQDSVSGLRACFLGKRSNSFQSRSSQRIRGRSDPRCSKQCRSTPQTYFFTHHARADRLLTHICTLTLMRHAPRPHHTDHHRRPDQDGVPDRDQGPRPPHRALPVSQSAEQRWRTGVGVVEDRAKRGKDRARQRMPHEPNKAAALGLVWWLGPFVCVSCVWGPGL